MGSARHCSALRTGILPNPTFICSWNVTQPSNIIVGDMPVNWTRGRSILWDSDVGTSCFKSCGLNCMQAVRDKGIASIAVVLKHSYIFPDHEKQVGQLASELGFTQVRSDSSLPVLCLRKVSPPCYTVSRVSRGPLFLRSIKLQRNLFSYSSHLRL